MVNNTVYHFVDCKLRIEISSKMRPQEKKGALKLRIEPPLHFYIGVSRNFHKACMFFYCFFGDENGIVFKKSIFSSLEY